VRPVFGWIHIHGIITKWSIDGDCMAIPHSIIVGFRKSDIKVTTSQQCFCCVFIVDDVKPRVPS
jgi:hypothetical protein